MRGDVLTLTRKMVVESCCNCGIEFGLASEFRDARVDDGKHFYCPAGHGQSYTGNYRTKLEKAQERIAGLERNNKAAWEKVEFEANQRKVAEREARRVKRRANAGVCQFCHRTFVALAVHVARQHGEGAECAK